MIGLDFSFSQRNIFEILGQLNLNKSPKENTSGDNAPNQAEVNYSIFSVLIIILLMVFIALILYYIFKRYCKQTEKKEIEYTRAILGDNTFEFSQIDTI